MSSVWSLVAGVETVPSHNSIRTPAVFGQLSPHEHQCWTPEVGDSDGDNIGQVTVVMSLQEHCLGHQNASLQGWNVSGDMIQVAF